MVIAAFFDGGQLQVQLLDKGRQFLVAQIFQDELVGFEDGQLIVVDVYDFLGVIDDRGGVAGQEMAVVTDADDQRRTSPRPHHNIGLVAA